MTGDEVQKETMCYGALSDIEMAGKVRMLYRDTLEHEAICTGARDRIMYLSQQLEKSNKLLEKVVSDSDIGIVPRSHIDNIEKFLAK